MQLRLVVSSIAVAVVALALSAPAQAAITVANQNDAGPGSLRQAIADATPGETIVLPAGTYTLTSEPLFVTKGLNISGHGVGDTVIRAGGPFSIFIASGTFDLGISDVTIRDSHVTTSGISGAVVAAFSNLNLHHVLITENSIEHNGGPGEEGDFADGAGIAYEGGRLTLVDSSVTRNVIRANGGSGAAGGEARGAGIAAGGPFDISGSTISGNVAEARGGQGAADPAQKGGLATGGGIATFPGLDAPASITDSTISGNLADASAGPGATNGDSGGGGLQIVSSSSATIRDTTIAANLARSLGTADGTVSGGGMFALFGSGASLELIGDTIAANRIEGPPPPESLGGNIFASGGYAVGDTIVSGGSGPAGSENCAGSPPTSLGFNLDSGDQCGFHAAGDQVNRDPLLGPLGNNGGLTQTMAPALGSPAIDQGASLGLGSDQRGVLRPIDFPTIPDAAAPAADGSDIGAVELQPVSAVNFGKLKKNPKRGTATLTVTLPEPSVGSLVLTGKGVKRQSMVVAGQSSLKLKVAAMGGAAKALKKKGKRKVSFEVTYTPIGNAAATKSGSTTLKRKPKHRPKQHKHKPKKH